MPNNKIFAGSDVIVDYELRKPNGDLVGTSRPATGTVTESTPEDLLPPFLVAPAADPIDVLGYPNGVTVRVEHLSALPGDQARLLEVNPLPGAKPFPLLTLNQNKRANFKLAPAFLVTRRGTAIKLLWELIRGGKPEDESTDLALTIRPIAENDPRLPTPNIASNTSSELKVQELTTDARILAAKWLLFELGQPIWVTCSGFDKNGNPVSKDVRSGEPNDSADGLSVAAPIDWLKNLKQKTELTITLKVNLDKRNIKDNSTSFPERVYEVKNHNNTGYENWETEDISEYLESPVNLPKTMKSGLTITSLIAPLYKPGLRFTSASNPGSGLKTLASGGHGASIKLALPSPSKRINFYYYASHTLNGVSFYDATNQLITQENIPPLNGVINFQSNYSCSYFIITVNDQDGGITIDDITWDI